MTKILVSYLVLLVNQVNGVLIGTHCQRMCVCVCVYLNFLKWAVDHCYEHVEEDDDHGNIVNSIKDIADIFDEFVSIINDDWFNLRKSKNSPEQCFKALLHSRERKEQLKERWNQT